MKKVIGILSGIVLLSVSGVFAQGVDEVDELEALLGEEVGNTETESGANHMGTVTNEALLEESSLGKGVLKGLTSAVKYNTVEFTRSDDGQVQDVEVRIREADDSSFSKPLPKGYKSGKVQFTVDEVGKYFYSLQAKDAAGNDLGAGYQGTIDIDSLAPSEDAIKLSMERERNMILTAFYTTIEKDQVSISRDSVEVEGTVDVLLRHSSEAKLVKILSPSFEDGGFDFTVDKVGTYFLELHFMDLEGNKVRPDSITTINIDALGNEIKKKDIATPSNKPITAFQTSKEPMVTVAEVENYDRSKNRYGWISHTTHYKNFPEYRRQATMNQIELMPDPDGVSGAELFGTREGRVEYCKKFFPDTETIMLKQQSYHSDGRCTENLASCTYTSRQPLYACAHNDIALGYVSAWQGKVNMYSKPTGHEVMKKATFEPVYYVGDEEDEVE